ncbi:hypothetical protein SCLO_1002780 [Sphingobium cloacae]|uniref:Uncharacterized protein n=1 Tax=Sphingobium cloacae TaxID=120107 RepID=A0A1E1EYH8_9SPHN|nr:hypothetical protein SCLO_1002780 [Sphingobium cloacae]
MLALALPRNAQRIGRNDEEAIDIRKGCIERFGAIEIGRHRQNATFGEIGKLFRRTGCRNHIRLAAFQQTFDNPVAQMATGACDKKTALGIAHGTFLDFKSYRD